MLCVLCDTPKGLHIPIVIIYTIKFQDVQLYNPLKAKWAVIACQIAKFCHELLNNHKLYANICCMELRSSTMSFISRHKVVCLVAQETSVPHYDTCILIGSKWLSHTSIPLKSDIKVKNWEYMVVKPQHIYGSYTFKANQSHTHHKITTDSAKN